MEAPSGPSSWPEHQLNGTRPTALRVRKDSHKIGKPPIAPPPAAEIQSHHHRPPPVIIYTVSPKIIHVNPNEFKSLVQRLTGPNSSSSKVNTSPPSTSACAFQESGGGISPEAPVTLPPIPQNSFPTKMNEHNKDGLIMPYLNLPQLPSPNNVDFFSTLFDL